MKNELDGVIERLLDAGISLPEATGILERGMIGGAEAGDGVTLVPLPLINLLHVRDELVRLLQLLRRKRVARRNLALNA